MELNASTQVNNHDSMANMMKQIGKARLQREVLADPSMAAKLVKVESTMTYNSNGEVVQAVSTDLGQA